MYHKHTPLQYKRSEFCHEPSFVRYVWQGCDQGGVGDSEKGAAVCISGSQHTGEHTHVQHVDDAHPHAYLRYYVAI